MTDGENAKLRDFFRKAQEGDPEAQCQLAKNYHEGKSKDYPNIAEALKWYLLAAEQGYTLALKGLVGFLTSFEEDVDIEQLKFLATQGDNGARICLGILSLYQDEALHSKDDNGVTKWFQLAAADGYAIAYYFLGYIIYFEGRGLEHNEVEAARHYKIAAEQNFSAAQTCLAWLYENGRGVIKNELEAFRLYKLAAEQGDPYAQYNLSEIYREGLLIGKDDIEAEKWYKLAAEKGVPEKKDFEIDN